MENSIDLVKKAREIESIISYSQNYDIDLDCSKIVEDWFEAKKKFITWFGGKTYWRSKKEMIVVLSTEEKDKIINDFINFVRMFWCNYSYEGLYLHDYIEKNKKGFFDNEVVSSIGKIPEKMKLSKSFKYFIQEPKNLRAFQDKYSLEVQKNVVKGYLFLSIDPVDFLTSSENNSNWHSCHSLDGDFRAGNLSYALDQTTFMAYLAPAEKEELKMINMPWYNKKWRMLVHCHKDDKWLVCGRGYPYHNVQLMGETMQVLNILRKAEWRSSFSDPVRQGFKKIIMDNLYGVEETIELNNQFLINGSIIPAGQIIKRGKDSLNYNDIINSPSYTPICSFTREFPHWDMVDDDFKEKVKIVVGHSVPCARAGCNGHCEESDYFVCGDCADEFNISSEDCAHYTCEKCGAWIPIGEEYINGGTGEILCCNCAEEDED